MWEQIESTLDKYVRPLLQEHCGEAEVTRIEGDTVYVRLLGRCADCAASAYTVDEVMETALREHVPGVAHVVREDLKMELYQFAKQLRSQKSQEREPPAF